MFGQPIAQVKAAAAQGTQILKQIDENFGRIQRNFQEVAETMKRMEEQQKKILEKLGGEANAGKSVQAKK